MKKITPPRCTACNKAAQEYESVKWPGVRVCFQCIKRFKDWMLVNHLANDNPVFYELCIAGFSEPSSSFMAEKGLVNVWGPSKHDSDPFVSTQWTVSIPHEFRKLSTTQERYTTDPLDML